MFSQFNWVAGFLFFAIIYLHTSYAYSYPALRSLSDSWTPLDTPSNNLRYYALYPVEDEASVSSNIDKRRFLHYIQKRAMMRLGKRAPMRMGKRAPLRLGRK